MPCLNVAINAAGFEARGRYPPRDGGVCDLRSRLLWCHDQVKTVKSQRSQSRVLPRKHRHRSAEQAFAVPLVIPAALLLILGVVTMMSRTTNSYLAITKQADALAARQAAESGMDRVLSLLNPFAKFSTDPYVSYLLASRWVPESGITLNTGVPGSTAVRSGWRLTTLRRAEVQTILRRCGFATRAQHDKQLPPDSETGYRDILSGATGKVLSGTNTELRYIVTDYVPPVPPPQADNSVPWPQECADFTTLSGGSAQITVEGRVIRNGRLISRYSLTRTIDVQGWPLPTLPVSWFSATGALRSSGGPPTGLRIAGKAEGLEQVSVGNYYDNFYSDSEREDPTTTNQSTKPQCKDWCPDSKGVPLGWVEKSYPKSETTPVDEGDLPRYPFNTNTPPSGLTPLQVNETNENYPYKPDSDDELVDECKKSETTDLNRPNQFRPNEIDCWIQSVGVGAEIKKIKYYSSGNVATITLDSSTPPARYDVRIGNRIKLDIKTGPLQGIMLGTVISTAASGTQINFTPDISREDDVNEYDIPKSTVSPASPITLTVNTEERPVNLIVLGDVGTADNPVIIKHMVKKSTNQKFVHSVFDFRILWNRLRLFGRQSTGAACSADQTLFIDPNPNTIGDASLGGSFVWLPRGKLVYGREDKKTPDKLLSVWWVCDLKVISSGAMMLITPFVGNPDAVTSVVPGGFINASGMFIPDQRFPVYPSLQRIRSAF